MYGSRHVLANPLLTSSKAKVLEHKATGHMSDEKAHTAKDYLADARVCMHSSSNNTLPQTAARQHHNNHGPSWASAKARQVLQILLQAMLRPHTTNNKIPCCLSWHKIAFGTNTCMPVYTTNTCQMFKHTREECLKVDNY